MARNEHGRHLNQSNQMRCLIASLATRQSDAHLLCMSGYMPATVQC